MEAPLRPPQKNIYTTTQMECNDFPMIFPYADVTQIHFSSFCYSSTFVVRDKTKEKPYSQKWATVK